MPPYHMSNSLDSIFLPVDPHYITVKVLKFFCSDMQTVQTFNVLYIL
jgi:hypothetical protein